MAEENKTVRTGENRRPRQNVNRSPKNSSGTMRDNLDHYRSDNVRDAKTRQANASMTREQKIAAIKKKRLIESRKQKRKGLIIRISTAVLIAAICVVCFFVTYNVFYDTALDPTSTEKYEIIIDESATDASVGQQLEQLGCIKDAKMYKTRAKIYDAAYVPGTYKVSPAFSTEKIVNILSGYDYSDGTMEEDD